MSVGLPSDEVAEDYKHSLEDLTINSRYEINNLTVIAKENTEHAMAISRVLENHIKNVLVLERLRHHMRAFLTHFQTPPDRKLPALYVLDSVVKNVGTPYTLFLGHNLYNTFMNAYTLVNPNVRRKLDEMLKTWKEPVPGSMDPRPVFAADIIRPIENALIKARTAFLQQQQQQQQQHQQQQYRSQQELMARGRSGAASNTPWRNTPTPPQANGRFYPPPQQGYVPQNISNGQHQARSPYPQYSQYPPPQPTPTSFPQPYQQPAAYSPYAPPPNNLDSLHRDIEDLIRTARIEFAANFNDTSIQTRLKALLDLQTILKSQQLPLEQIQAIRDQVAQLSAAPRLAPGPAHPAPTPSQYVHNQQAPQHQPPVPPQPPAQAPTPHTTDLQALLSSKNLANIIAKANQAPSTPPPSQVQLPPTSPSNAPAFSSPGGSNSLLASLRAAGMLPADSNTPVNGSLGYGPPSSAIRTPPLPLGGAQRPPLINDVELTSASLKIPRPHLLSNLYEARPNQCSTCGRRFLATEDGREKKARHLDWHFRTNQRLIDSAKRGQSRSWYVDELEWIKSRDNPEDAPSTDASSNAAKAAIAASALAADPKNKHIPVPSDLALANQPCPICQEKFNTVWSEEVQDFVWMDAIKIGSRVYHASCHSELKQEGGTTPLRTATPDSVLGKRKAASNISEGLAKAIKA